MKFAIKEFFINAFVFIRQNPTISYSLLLIVLLPLVLFFSTFLTIELLEGTIKSSIQAQAEINQDTVALLFLRDFPNKDSLDQQKLQREIDMFTGNSDAESAAAAGDAIGREQNYGYAVGEGAKFENIRAIVKEGRDLKIIAAQNRDDVGKKIVEGPSFSGESLIFSNWASAAKNFSEIDLGSKKYWRIAPTLSDSATGEVYLLISADISTDKVANEISYAVWQAYAILVAVIMISLFLVFQHTKLFSYVVLSKKLQVENKAKDNFIRMATHELRSPVTVINAYVEALKDELASIMNPEQKQYIDRVSMSVRNLSDLMDDILEVSHIQQGRTDFKPEIITPATVIKEIVDGIKPKAEAKNLVLSFDGADFKYNINVNLVCFKRIITNLVENSVKYTPAGKVAVSIKAETAKKRCVITVQDTGFGISAEGQSKLFEQFYRVKTEENAGIPGTGLGLWMSREMARKMGGDIMLESIERMGSRFFVYFPLSDK